MLAALQAKITSVVQSHASLAGFPAKSYWDWMYSMVWLLAVLRIWRTMVGKYSGRPVSCDVPIPYTYIIVSMV
jgi:hypothetical protein